MPKPQKKKKREIILSTAAALFRERGYAATSMRDLAKAVGMEAASLYNHIRSKQEILAELLLDIANRFISGMDEVEDEGLSSLEKIEALISLHIRITVEHTDAISLITQDWRHLEGDAYLNFNAKRKDYERRFRQIIEEGIRTGGIKPLNPDVALFSILSTMRWLYAWYSKKKGLDESELRRQFSDVLISGMRELRSLSDD